MKLLLQYPVRLGRGIEKEIKLKPIVKQLCYLHHKKRVKVEAKFGEGERKYLLDLVMAKRPDTSDFWIGSLFFVMNIAYLLQVIFLSFFEKVHFCIA